MRNLGTFTLAGHGAMTHEVALAEVPLQKDGAIVTCRTPSGNAGERADPRFLTLRRARMSSPSLG